MNVKMIPFYTEYKNTSQNYTLFIEHKSNRIYKAFHRKVNKLIYVIAFAFVLAVLRGIQSLHLPVKRPLLLLAFILFGFVISVFIGMYSYKKFTYEKSREVFITKSALNSYMIKGERVLKTELWTVSMIALSSIILSLFFLITQSLILYVFIIACFILINALICRFPKERFKLNKGRGEL